MSAIGLPSYSSPLAMRLMSEIDRAPRKASRKLSDSRLRLANSRSLVTSSAQERIEHRARPRITVFTTQVALMNMVTGVSLPASLIVVGAPAAGAEESAGAAAADESAGAGAAEAAESAAGAADDWAKAGALTISAIAPSRAMMGVFNLLSDICRQFLIGLTR